MEKEEIIQKTIDFVKNTLKNSESGHDYYHIQRVYNNAKNIGKNENVDLFTVELGALLHDIADAKFHNGNEEIGPKKAKEFLQTLNLDNEIINHIQLIIKNISFKGKNNIQEFKSPELDVVQDADRLDAMGAIGIARCFNYGGYINRPIYDPDVKPNINMTKEEYYANKSNSTSLNHFYEKLLLLKDRMNTKTGKSIAEQRHKFMENYLNQFYDEWDGKK